MNYQENAEKIIGWLMSGALAVQIEGVVWPFVPAARIDCDFDAVRAAVRDSWDTKTKEMVLAALDAVIEAQAAGEKITGEPLFSDEFIAMHCKQARAEIAGYPVPDQKAA